MWRNQFIKSCNQIIFNLLIWFLDWLSESLAKQRDYFHGEKTRPDLRLFAYFAFCLRVCGPFPTLRLSICSAKTIHRLIPWELWFLISCVFMRRQLWEFLCYSTYFSTLQPLAPLLTVRCWWDSDLSIRSHSWINGCCAPSIAFSCGVSYRMHPVSEGVMEFFWGKQWESVGISCRDVHGSWP